METQELVMPADAGFRVPCTLELTSRAMGRNTVGVVSWLMLLRTPECPDGRQVSTCRLCSSHVTAFCDSSTAHYLMANRSGLDDHAKLDMMASYGTYSFCCCQCKTLQALPNIPDNSLKQDIALHTGLIGNACSLRNGWITVQLVGNES